MSFVKLSFGRTVARRLKIYQVVGSFSHTTDYAITVVNLAIGRISVMGEVSNAKQNITQVFVKE